MCAEKISCHEQHVTLKWAGRQADRQTNATTIISNFVFIPQFLFSFSHKFTHMLLLFLHHSLSRAIFLFFFSVLLVAKRRTFLHECNNPSCELVGLVGKKWGHTRTVKGIMRNINGGRESRHRRKPYIMALRPSTSLQHIHNYIRNKNGVHVAQDTN